MISNRDGHIRLLPLHVANKIAAGEVVERPASVVKELVENAIDAGAHDIRIGIVQGGRKLVSVQDDGSGMTRDDALLSFERQATSKILDVDDIEQIDTLGFRGEAIPSIASVSRFSMSTRRREADEGTFIQVNAGTMAEVRAKGCPPGTLIEVRDLFCNVPARRKFLRAYTTEENHVKTIFTVHALAHPAIGFTLTVDGHELYHLAPAEKLTDRVREIFSDEFLENLLPLDHQTGSVRVRGFIERPNRANPSRRDQYIFINGRPATAPSITYALREAYPHTQDGVRPSVILFLELPPNQVDVNVHPTKREVRFRDNGAVKQAIYDAIAATLLPKVEAQPVQAPASPVLPPVPHAAPPPAPDAPHSTFTYRPPAAVPVDKPVAAPLPQELPMPRTEGPTALWNWFKYLATTGTGYLLLETDAGLVTLNPTAARERIAFERLRDHRDVVSQHLLLPETVKLSPPEFARLEAGLTELRSMGFELESFGQDTFKIEAVPQLAENLPVSEILHTLAHDLGESGTRRIGEHWRADLISRTLARQMSRPQGPLTPELATHLVEELARCRMPYVTPRGKPVLIFTSNRELSHKFAVD